MKFKRIICALLASVMLLGTLASCAVGDGSSETTVDPSATETEAETLFSPDLPEDLDYEGDEVTIISRYKEGWTSGEIAVEGLMGEPVNDAVFERNRLVEQRLNIKIISVEDKTDSHDSVVHKVATAVRGGLKDYDIMAAPCYTTMSETLNGTFVNLRGSDCEYLDLSQPWWTQGFNEAVEYQGGQYAILGSMVLSMYRFGFITVFNKDMFTDAGQPFLYEYVQNGTWTLSKQAELVPLFYKDDGNGIQDEVGDVYGFVSSGYTNVDAYWSGCQLDIIRKDGDGNLQLVTDMERLNGTVDKLIHLFYNMGGASYIVPGTSDDNIWNTIRQMFSDGGAAMAAFRFMEMENAVMRNMEQEYGVVPTPKYDEHQDEHYTLLHDQFTVLAVPVTVEGEDLSQVSAVLEAMSSASYAVVKPVYYEENLRTKIAQDPTAAEMMDIITENVYIDAGIIYISVLGEYHHYLRNIVRSRTNSSASLYKSINMACKKSITNNLVRKLNKLNALTP